VLASVPSRDAVSLFRPFYPIAFFIPTTGTSFLFHIPQPLHLAAKNSAYQCCESLLPVAFTARRRGAAASTSRSTAALQHIAAADLPG
jgi:hypothetical protein